MGKHWEHGWKTSQVLLFTISSCSGIPKARGGEQTCKKYHLSSIVFMLSKSFTEEALCICII